jgi:hypothetical protein
MTLLGRFSALSTSIPHKLTHCTSPLCFRAVFLLLKSSVLSVRLVMRLCKESLVQTSPGLGLHSLQAINATMVVVVFTGTYFSMVCKPASSGPYFRCYGRICGLLPFSPGYSGLRASGGCSASVHVLP